MYEAIIGPASPGIIRVKPAPPVGSSLNSGPFFLGQAPAAAQTKQSLLSLASNDISGDMLGGVSAVRKMVGGLVSREPEAARVRLPPP